MQKEELKTLVKKYFNLTEINNTENIEEVKDEAVKATFAEATLVDGTRITNMLDAEFEVGQELHVITQEGEHVIAPSGEHATESGITITVDGEGKITGVARPDGDDSGSLAEEEMSAESTEETVTEESTKEELAEEEIIEEVMEDDVKLEEIIIEAIAEIVAPEIEALKATLADHEEKLKEYMSQPASEPVEEAKAKFSATLTPKSQVWDKEPFNQKKAQYDMILKQKAKQSKTLKNN
jgi:hypothetical protein